MRRFFFLIGALLLSVAAFAQQYDNDFTQTRIMTASGRTINMAGHLTFDGVGNLSMIYSDPEGDYFIIDGKTVKINLLKKKNELNSDKVASVGLLRTTLLNCLLGNWQQAAIDNNANTSVTEKDGFQYVVITAKDIRQVPKGGYTSMELTYRLSDHMVTRMALEERNGVRNIYELK